MSLRITMKYKGRDLPKDWAAYVQAFGPYLQKAHTAAVIGVVADFVAWSRVDTGRMRGGWLPMLINHQYPYSGILGSKETDPTAVQDGISQSAVTETPFRTIIENGVYYTEYVEKRVGVFDVDGASSFMKAPVKNLQEAMNRVQDKMSRDMQSFIDSIAAAWNNGTGNYSGLVPAPTEPSPQD